MTHSAVGDRGLLNDDSKSIVSTISEGGSDCALSILGDDDDDVMMMMMTSCGAVA